MSKGKNQKINIAMFLVGRVKNCKDDAEMFDVITTVLDNLKCFDKAIDENDFTSIINFLKIKNNYIKIIRNEK